MKKLLILTLISLSLILWWCFKQDVREAENISKINEIKDKIEDKKAIEGTQSQIQELNKEEVKEVEQEKMIKYNWFLKATDDDNKKIWISFEYNTNYKLEEIEWVVFSIKSKNNDEIYLQFQILNWDGKNYWTYWAKFKNKVIINKMEFEKFFTNNALVPVIEESWEDNPIPFTAYILDLKNWLNLEVTYFWEENPDFEKTINTIKIIPLNENPVTNKLLWKYFKVENWVVYYLYTQMNKWLKTDIDLNTAQLYDDNYWKDKNGFFNWNMRLKWLNANMKYKSNGLFIDEINNKIYKIWSDYITLNKIQEINDAKTYKYIWFTEIKNNTNICKFYDNKTYYDSYDNKYCYSWISGIDIEKVGDRKY